MGMNLMSHQRITQVKMSDTALHKGTEMSNKPILSNYNPVHSILQLQKMVGNRAVKHLIQTKLKVGQPGDVYEQEADRVADMVMRMPEPEASLEEKVSEQVEGINIQRKCKACEQEEEKQMLQAKEDPGHILEVTPHLESNLNAIKGGGQPLPASVRAFFEPRFGQDFSQVRIHTGEQVAGMASSINARAFTSGKGYSVWIRRVYTRDSGRQEVVGA